MSRSERRSGKRYVIDGLLLEIGGVDHETVDISARSVAVIRKPGIDYTSVKPPFRFKTGRVAEINHCVSGLKVVRERAATIVFEYRPECTEWEDTLKRHDVRAGVRPLEDVFG